MRNIDRFRGCLIGGAAGDALGYAVEFEGESWIFKKYGAGGIAEYELTRGVAEISDDTQMTLFTATGLMYAKAHENAGPYIQCINDSYIDWLQTQSGKYPLPEGRHSSWLVHVPELFSLRAPGNSCLSALESGGGGTIERPLNASKGCGGVMRVAPIGLYFNDVGMPVEEIDRLGAGAAVLTHGHALGWMPAAALVHIIHEVSQDDATIMDATLHALDSIGRIWPENEHRARFTGLMRRAVELASGDAEDLKAIHELGEGWVGDEALAIAVYCVLKYPTDFDRAIIAAVNHRGDSDSTGAIAGNILGAKLGLEGIPEKYVGNLELKDVILEVADDLFDYCRDDLLWKSKYRDATYEPQASAQNDCPGCRGGEIVDIDLFCSILPLTQATVIRMYYQDGLTDREIADRLGVSVNRVEKTRARALERLKQPDHGAERKEMPDM